MGTVSAYTVPSYSAALTYCAGRGRTLARIHSAQQDAIASATCGHRVCYIDLAEHSGHDGDWTWSDGTKPTYTNWAPGEPNNFRGVPERYAVINHGSNPARGWDDYPDVSSNYALCSPLGLGPTTPLPPIVSTTTTTSTTATVRVWEPHYHVCRVHKRTPFFSRGFSKYGLE